MWRTPLHSSTPTTMKLLLPSTTARPCRRGISLCSVFLFQDRWPLLLEVQKWSSFLFPKDRIFFFPESLLGKVDIWRFRAICHSFWTHSFLFFNFILCGKAAKKKKKQFSSSMFSCFGTAFVKCFLKGTNPIFFFFGLFVSTFGPDALVVSRSFLIKTFYSKPCCSEPSQWKSCCLGYCTISKLLIFYIIPSPTVLFTCFPLSLKNEA